MTKNPLVLVPGIDGTGLLFYRQLPLLERRYAVTTTRLRDDAARMGELVEDLHAAVSAAAPDGQPVTLLGESFGGALTLSYAVAHPERVARLVIVNSFAHFGSKARLLVGYHLLRAMPWGLMPVVRHVNASRMHSPQTSREEIRRFLGVMRGTTRDGYLSRLRILRDYDIRGRLPEITSPTLFLAADCDHLLPSVQQARLMQSLTPGSAMRVLEGHGHSCLIAPDLDLGSILEDWVAREDR